MFPEKLFYSDAPAVSFDHLPEVSSYTRQPEQMYVGCPGKHGYLDLVFEKNSEGKSILRKLNRRAPLIVQQELYFDEAMPDLPCVYILSSGGPNVDGDRFVQNFHLKKDSMAWISTGAATKLAEMKRNYSGMRQKIVLEENAYLEYMPEPVIPCKHTRYVSDTQIICHETATLFYSEIYMPGRKYYKDGEIFEYDLLSICTHGERPNGQQLFREKYIIEPEQGHIRNLGVMANYDVFGNVMVLTPTDKAQKIYQQITPFIDSEKKLACGISTLPRNAGLLFKVLGMEPGPVKKLIREFCSLIRQTIKNRPLPPQFPWR